MKIFEEFLNGRNRMPESEREILRNMIREYALTASDDWLNFVKDTLNSRGSSDINLEKAEFKAEFYKLDPLEWDIMSETERKEWITKFLPTWSGYTEGNSFIGMIANSNYDSAILGIEKFLK